MKRGLTFVSGILLFLNIFIAAMILTSSWVLTRSNSGRLSLAFGFVMIFASVILKIKRKW